MSVAPSPLQQQQQQVTQAKVPIQKEKSPEFLAVASFLRNHPLLKNRAGTVNGQGVEFFRYKRCIRALTSADYQSSVKKYNLPEQPDLLNNDQLAQKIFVGLISNQLVIPVTKLSTQDARQQGFKPTKQSPCLVPSTKCVLADNEYFQWTFTPANPLLPLYSLLGIVTIMTLICFPLWPMFMRRGAWYVSMLLLGAIGLLFIIAIIRLVVFLVLSPFYKFWIFPNLFADVGFIDSFIPLYGFETPKVKGAKTKKTKTGGNKTTTTNTNTNTNTNTKATATGVSSNNNGTTTKRKVTLEDVQE